MPAASSRSGEATTCQLLETPNAVPSANEYREQFWIRQRGTDSVRVLMADVDWITAEDDYACLNANGRRFLVRSSLDRLMAQLDPKRFARIHRSTIVSIDRVAAVVLLRPGVRECVLLDGTRLAFGRIQGRRLGWTPTDG